MGIIPCLSWGVTFVRNSKLTIFFGFKWLDFGEIIIHKRQIHMSIHDFLLFSPWNRGRLARGPFPRAKRLACTEDVIYTLELLLDRFIIICLPSSNSLSGTNGLH
jgi:hypothetical protein